MAYYPQSATGLDCIAYPVGPTAAGLAIFASASTNTKGSYTEFVASSTFDTNVVSVMIEGITQGDRRILFDIATGAAGAEVDILPNCLTDSVALGQGGAGNYTIPMFIPSGTRITGRTQCTVASNQITAVLTLSKAGDTPGITQWTNYGSDTSDSTGVTLTPSTFANTKGAFAQLTASTSAVVQCVMQMYGCAPPPTTAMVWRADLATGAGGAEVVLIPDQTCFESNLNAFQDFMMVPRSRTFLTYIAASTRIAMRVSCSAAGSVTMDAALLTGTAPAEPSGGGVGMPVPIPSLPPVQAY